MFDPHPKIVPVHHHKQYSTYDKQALHSKRHKKHKARYALATRQLLAKIRVPTYQPAPKNLVSTIDTNLENIKEWEILDSGARSHFPQVDAPLLRIKETMNPIEVTVANGEKVGSTHKGFIDVLQLPEGARNAHVLPGTKHSLLLIVRLYAMPDAR